MTTVAPLAPEVLDRLKTLQEQDRPISVDEILFAANLNHLTTSSQKEKSTTLAERRKHPEKLTLSNPIERDTHVLKRLEQENAKLPAQDSEEYMLAHLERQNALLNADPKSVSIESNRLQADFTTIRNLVSDATFSPVREDYEETIQAMLAKVPLKENTIQNDDEWDFWQQVVKDFPTAVAKFPHLLAAKLQNGGIPHRIRGVIWQAMAQSSSLNLESLYHRLSEESETSSYERVIQRDLSRTFPQLDMFKDDGGEGQLAMGRLLKAYSLYDAHVGYCQGLAFLVGPLLMTMPEQQAFCVFVRLMETYDMRTMFTLNMEGLHLRLHQFGILLAQLCPRLDAHLQQHQIHTAMYASQWYLTLFAYSFPISLVLRIYDLVFAEGAVETITRVAIAIMQKNEDALIEITEFEQLMMYLSSRKLYQVAYNSDPEAVIHDAMALSSVITKQKMDSISESYYREMEQEKTRTQQALAIRFGGWGLLNKSPSSPTTPKRPSNNKRDSWFSWGANTELVTKDSITPPSSLTTSQEEVPQELTPPSSLTSSQTEIPQDRTIPLLHEQIEDLVKALSQLQKENCQISEDLMTTQMREMDLIKERDQLTQKNRLLEKQLWKKYNPMASGEGQPSPVESLDSIIKPGEEKKIQMLQKEAEFVDFVESLKLSGDFGSLIAGALTTSKPVSEDARQVFHDSTQQQRERNEVLKTAAAHHGGMDEVTSELVAIKLANFEMGQKYQDLCEKHERLNKTLKTTTEGQAALLEKIMKLQTTIESLQIDKEKLMQERDSLIKENEALTQASLATKKTCSDLQLEKTALDDERQQLQNRVQELEDQRREYLMPRGSFTEEVFAAHQTLFGSRLEAPPMSRRHTVQLLSDDDHYQKKYMESDLRCRELEKLLAETKVKLVECETSLANTNSLATPRGSLQQNKRPNSALYSKRSSSFTVMTNTSSNVSIGPQSPTFLESRESIESLRSTTSTSSYQQKRASMYSRFLNVLGNGSVPEIIEEPRS
ncbi:rab-GTPase-TBC domain-containing protein [Gilbertella persicaria]|uniref:rab-GTPase-TBC domain-containing protein n=1 Tax=Gilbertella persicaria TaxID=101096 RepID=UPI00222090E5|nr:rab-GTPase-TBC domain-containing protein [Gilbertella persicaria]KAI8056536.1 rab-GTPase-TBC domain-containing protein [Gilbertella persicaria]